MKIVYTKSKWEMPGAGIGEFLARCRADGFDGAELYVNGVKEAPREVADAVRRHGLWLTCQVAAHGRTAEEQLRELDAWVPFAAACGPARINFHIGKDYLPLDDNARIIRHALGLAARHGLAACCETHRGRPTSTSMGTLPLLDLLPELRLAADFSHWMCAHESDLGDQPEAVARVVERADLIHARVGFDQGPQVGHPLAPEHRHWLDAHAGIWRRIVERRRGEGAEFLPVTPEFGPLPYMPALPFTGQPVADTWTVNREFLRWLRENLG